MVVAATTSAPRASATGLRRLSIAGNAMVCRHPLRMALLACSCLASSAVWSQNQEELQRLIFEPAPLPPAAISANTAAGVQPATVPTTETSTASELLSEPDTLGADITRYEQRINSLITTENAYSQNLREQYSALGLLQQKSGDHDGAILSLENAMHIDRVNEGLFTVTQIPLVESIIASHSALGNFSAVDDYHEYLYYIQLKTWPETDPRLLAAKENWADWNVESYLKQGMAPAGGAGMNFSTGATRGTDYVAIQDPVTGSWNYVPRNQMPNVLNPNGMLTNAAMTNLYASSAPFAVSPEMMVDPRLRKARDLYEEISELRGDDGTTNAAFRADHKLANISWAVKRQFDLLESATDIGSLNFNRAMQPRTTASVVTRGYTRSRDDLEAIAGRLEADSAIPRLEAAQAWIYVGDWHIGFNRTPRAEDAYARAWMLLQEAGIDAAGIAAVFTPAPIIPVPAFAIHPFSRTLYGLAPDALIEYQGHIDVTLGVDRNGRVRAPRIDAVSEGTGQQLRSQLLDFLRETSVRPAVIDGKLAAQEDLKIRYYYSY
jgi:hypothetical protein